VIMKGGGVDIAAKYEHVSDATSCFHGNEGMNGMICRLLTQKSTSRNYFNNQQDP